MDNYDFNDYNNNFSEETENLRENARISSGNEPNNDSFSLNNNSNLALNNDGVSNNQHNNDSPFAEPSQTDFNNQTPEIAPTNVKPQFEQFQNQNDVSAMPQPSFEQENINHSFAEQPISPIQQSEQTFAEQSEQTYTQPIQNQQSAVRFSPNVDTTAPVRYGASSDQVPEQTYKYVTQQTTAQQSETVQPAESTSTESNLNNQEQSPIQQNQPVTAREVSTPKEVKNTKKYTFFEDTEEDIVIETKKEQKQKLKQQQKEDKIAKKNAMKSKDNKRNNENDDEQISRKSLFAEADQDEDLPKAKKKSKNKVRAVSLIKMFFTRLIMLLPIIGILFCLIVALIPKTNKNIRNLALTSIFFQLIGYAILVFFFMNGGLGYLIEWFFDLTGYVSWSF